MPSVSVRVSCEKQITYDQAAVSYPQSGTERGSRFFGHGGNQVKYLSLLGRCVRQIKHHTDLLKRRARMLSRRLQLDTLTIS